MPPLAIASSVPAAIRSALSPTAPPPDSPAAPSPPPSTPLISNSTPVRAANPVTPLVIPLGEGPDRGITQVSWIGRHTAGGGRCPRFALGQSARYLPRLAGQVSPAVLPRARDGLDQPGEVPSRVIGTAVEGLAIVGKGHGHRPAAPPRHPLG